MKHFKTKLGLSVLALACLGAGVISLQPTVSAKADGANESGLVMTKGAMVRVAEGWSGIRWETTVKAGVYDENAVFGVIVAPTKSLVDGDTVIELRHDTVDCELDLIADGFTASATEDTNFYSVINYDNLTQETGIDLKQAYKLELTARAYVQIDGVYYYASLAGINTSRSARQVAIAAELDGALVGDQESAFKYYGDTKYILTEEQKNTGAVGTTVVDLENPETAVAVNGFGVAANEIEEVLIGGERISAEYVGDVFTIKEANYIPTGEHYITVFKTNGDIYTQPVIGATKVIKKADDLSIFNAKGNKGTNTTKHTQGGVDLTGNWDSEQEDSGYYVLGGNINAEGYVHGSKNEDGTWNDASWNGAASYAGKPIGLTGTFNGMGYAIVDLEIGGVREGIFGIVNGGTVKNVAITDVKAEGTFKFVLANYLVGATIENVYIRTEAYEEGVTKGFSMSSSAGLANYAVEGTNLISCVVECLLVNGISSPTGILVNAYSNGVNCTDVFCVSANTIGSNKRTHTLMYLKSGSNPCIGIAANEDGTQMINDKLLPSNTTNYPHVTFAGAYRYNTIKDMIADETYYSFDKLASSCWTEDESGVPVWKSLLQQA